MIHGAGRPDVVDEELPAVFGESARTSPWPAQLRSLLDEARGRRGRAS
ncbi:MAG: hypothetical protein MZU95_01410 [Desulfomicrobium escambiense]|nr:hypothetical protein [Desulfomicrobium escambiense]